MYPITLGTLLRSYRIVPTILYERSVQTTATDSGSVDFASLHGCDLLGQRICTGRTVVGQRRSSCRGAVVEEQLSRSYCRGASHLPDSLAILKKKPQLLHSYEISGLTQRNRTAVPLAPSRSTPARNSNV